MKKKLLVLFLTLCLLGAIVMYVSKHLVISSVECTNQYGPCTNEVNKIIDQFVGTRYILTRTEIQDALTKSGRIKEYKFQYNFDGTLKAQVVELKPEVALRLPDNTFYLYDANGNYVGHTNESELPAIKLTSDIPQADKLNFAIDLFEALFRYYSVKSAQMDGFGLTAVVNNNTIIFPLEGDVDTLLGSLEVVLLRLNKPPEDSTIIAGSGTNYTVDLRYNNPVIYR